MLDGILRVEVKGFRFQSSRDGFKVYRGKEPFPKQSHPGSSKHKYPALYV